MNFLSFLPSIIGGIAGLFKGKKQKYANEMTPQQQAAYNAMLQLLQNQAGQGSAGYKPTSDALSMLYQTFLPGMNYTPSTGAYNFPKVNVAGSTPRPHQQTWRSQ